MNSSERVFATITGKPVDHRPYTATLSLYGAKLINCTLPEYYTIPELYAEGQQAVLETFSPDIIFSPFFLCKISLAFGGEIKYFDKMAPNLLKPPFKTADDFLNTQLPDIDSNPHLLYLRQSIRLMSKTFGSTTPIAGIFLTPSDLPVMLFGLDNWLQIFLFDEYKSNKIIEKTSEFYISVSKAFIDDGVACIVLPCAFSSPAIVPREMAEARVIPLNKKVFSESKVPVILHHGGGRIQSYLDLYQDMPENIIGYAIDSKDELEVCRKIIPENKLLLAGLDGPTLWARSQEDIYAECTEILKKAKSDSHFILITSSADLAYDTAPENILSIRKSVEEFK